MHLIRGKKRKQKKTKKDFFHIINKNMAIILIVTGNLESRLIIVIDYRTKLASSISRNSLFICTLPSNLIPFQKRRVTPSICLNKGKHNNNWLKWWTELYGRRAETHSCKAINKVSRSFCTDWLFSSWISVEEKIIRKKLD